jgi:hypothetical protein
VQPAPSANTLAAAFLRNERPGSTRRATHRQLGNDATSNWLLDQTPAALDRLQRWKLDAKL